MMHTHLPHPAIDPKLLERKAILIQPGQIEVQNHTPLATLLGSCVAICLYDPHLHLAGMNHFMLPHFRDRTNGLENGIYSGMASMDSLINAMMKHGAHKSRLTAKGFGGSNMLQGEHVPSVGESNIAFAQQWLSAEKIPIVATDWGGNWARKIIFDPKTGDVYSRQIHKQYPQIPALARAESNYESQLKMDITKAKVDYW